MKPHPNLSDNINFNLLQSEQDGGVWVDKVPLNSGLQVQTVNTLYTLRRFNDGRWTIQGHPHYCPTESRANIHGSTWGGSCLKLGFIGINMHMEIGLVGKIITTSPVVSIKSCP